MDINTITERLKFYTDVELSPDLRLIPDNQKQIIECLVAAGNIADDIFWSQSSHDAITIREHYKGRPGPEKDYIKINYGPYDRLFEFERFIGKGADKKPEGAGFYPEDLSRNEFLHYLKNHPEKKDKFEDL